MRVSTKSLYPSRIEIIFLIFVLIGIVTGIVLYLCGTEVKVVEWLVNNTFDKKRTIFSGDVFIRCFVYSVLLLLVIFVCGYSAVLQPLIFLSCLFWGLTCGYSMSLVYSSRMNNVVVFAFLSVVIPFMVILFALLIAWRESYYLSVNIAKALFSTRNFIGFKDVVIVYSVRFVVLLAIIAVGCFLRCLTLSFI